LSFVEELERTRARRAILLAAVLDDRQGAYYEGRGYRREERIERPVGKRPALLRRLVADAEPVD
jgi:hypothetical protein